MENTSGKIGILINIKNSEKKRLLTITNDEFLSLIDQKSKFLGELTVSDELTIKSLKKLYPDLEKVNIESVLFNSEVNPLYVPSHRILTRERVEKCISIICGNEIDFSNGKDRFVEDLGMDSLDMVELMIDLEHEFNLDIPDEEVEDVSTISQAVEYIKERN